MELEMSTESEAMFARKPRRWIKRIRRELCEQAIEEKGISRRAAQEAVDSITDEQIMHATYGVGITAEQIGDGFGSWFDWIRDIFSKVDWLKVVQVLLPLIFMFLQRNPMEAKPCDTGDAE